MSIYIDENTKVLVQGITGNQGAFHTEQMLEYGTKIIGGVSPGKGGKDIHGVPVYDSVKEAMGEEKIDASVIFVPAKFAKSAALEAMEGGIKILVLIPEHIPVHDEMEIMAEAKERKVAVIGPNTFGIVSSGKSKIGIMPNKYFLPGPVGIISRSGTLSYEIVGALKDEKIGTSTVIGLGGDRVVGLSFKDILPEMDKDPETKVIVLIGEIGGSSEEEAAGFIKGNIKKPVVAYLAGKSAPEGKRMGHAGAIVERGMGTLEGKVKALEEAGVLVASLTFDLPDLVKNFL